MDNNIEKEKLVFGKKIKLEGKMKEVWEFVKFILIALIIVVPIRMFIAQPFVVSGESMFPTFNDREYLIVDELSYIISQPKRGDVTIFRYPQDPSRFFIKRIIGMPNEEIKIDTGKITIINSENPEGFVLEEPYIFEEFETTKTYKTGNKEYFVLGDNRNRSSDSRVWGVLPKKFMKGRAFLRLFPLKDVSYLPGLHNYNK